MIYRRIYDAALSQASYLVGCAASREAVLVDPARDIDRYEDAAAEAGVRIVVVAETHHHADFVSGVRAFAATRPVQVFMSGVSDRAQWTADGGLHADASARFLGDGDTFEVGSLRLRARATPGHTRESLSFELIGRDHLTTALLTGDFLFAGEVGRPDLGSLATRGMTVDEGVEALRTSLALLDDMTDGTTILPGHGAGSACGKMIAGLSETTVGIERIINKALRLAGDPVLFRESVLHDIPDPPPYFARVKALNEVGPAVHESIPFPPCLSAAEFLETAARPGCVVVDMRDWNSWVEGHLPGALFVLLDQWFAPTVANYLEAGDEVLIVADATTVKHAVRIMYRVGIDRFAGWISPSEFNAIDAGHLESSGCEDISPRDARARIQQGGVGVIDVRTCQEFADGHLDEARHIPYVQIPARIGELDPSVPLIVYCHRGNRSARACAYLRRRGFQVTHLLGGYFPYAGRGF